jgi:hypothetical protein
MARRECDFDIAIFSWCALWKCTGQAASRSVF